MRWVGVSSSPFALVALICARPGLAEPEVTHRHATLVPAGRIGTYRVDVPGRGASPLRFSRPLGARLREDRCRERLLHLPAADRPGREASRGARSLRRRGDVPVLAEGDGDGQPRSRRDRRGPDPGREPPSSAGPHFGRGRRPRPIDGCRATPARGCPPGSGGTPDFTRLAAHRRRSRKAPVVVGRERRARDDAPRSADCGSATPGTASPCARCSACTCGPITGCGSISRWASESSQPSCRG